MADEVFKMLIGISVKLDSFKAASKYTKSSEIIIFHFTTSFKDGKHFLKYYMQPRGLGAEFLNGVLEWGGV